ncbi:MAG: helix-turn-helix transcriptional regulator [Chromatiales bacterium]|nr:helix-turn-helix transcriptional regulator [Chromatiales bacterium]
MEYGQFCPIAKAMEILGERWTLLIVRELLMGARRFNELQRGLNLISPTILTKRLNDLADNGVILRRRIAGQRGFEYLPTEMCQQLLPVLLQLGEWGMRWARGGMDEGDLDVELLMLYLERSIKPDMLPGGQAVVRFTFTDLEKFRDWWLIVAEAKTELCIRDPGKEIDIYFTVDLRTMIEVWMGDTSYREATQTGRLKIIGPSVLTRDIKSWLTPSVFAGIPSAAGI